MNACSQAELAQCSPFGWLAAVVTIAPFVLTQRERIKDFKHAYLAMSLTAMFLVCVFFLLLSLLSMLLISDAASLFNGHYDQIPGRDRGGSE